MHYQVIQTLLEMTPVLSSDRGFSNLSDGVMHELIERGCSKCHRRSRVTARENYHEHSTSLLLRNLTTHVPSYSYLEAVRNYSLFRNHDPSYLT